MDRSRAEIGRQALLSRPDGPEFVFIIDEFALHRTIGGVDVMRRQLH